MTPRELADRLADGEIGPRGGAGACPAHAPARLHFSLNGAGHLDLRCDDATCTPEDVAAALGVSLDELLGQVAVPSAEAPPSSSSMSVDSSSATSAGTDPALHDAVSDVIAEIDPWARLKEIEREPVEQRAVFYDQIVGKIAASADAGIIKPVGIDMLIKRVAEIFPGHTRADIHADVARLNGGADGLQGQRLGIADVELWPARVDGAALLDEIAAVFQDYVILPEHGDTLLSLATVSSHAIDAFDISPIIALQSPVKRCGKTRLLEVFGVVARRPLAASNISVSALYRAVERVAPTLLVDEFETQIKDNEALRGILNSGHTRATAFVLRCVGDDHEPRRFSTWGMRVLALIGRLPDTLEDRAIVIRLARKKPGERVARLRHGDRETFKPLASRIARWVSDHARALQTTEPQVLDGLDDRAFDNWSGLFSIASVAGGAWPERARLAALALSGVEARADESRGVLLLEDVYRYFAGDHERDGVDRVYTDNLIKWLVGDAERPWATWSRGRPLTPKQFADLLRPFGIRRRQIRAGGTTGKGYLKADFEDTWARYLPGDRKHRKQVPDFEDLDGNRDPKHNHDVSDANCVISTENPGFVSGVSDQTSPEGVLARPRRVPATRLTRQLIPIPATETSPPRQPVRPGPRRQPATRPSHQGE